MGYSRTECESALLQAGNDVNRAAEILLRLNCRVYSTNSLSRSSSPQRSSRPPSSPQWRAPQQGPSAEERGRASSYCENNYEKLHREDATSNAQEHISLILGNTLVVHAGLHLLQLRFKNSSIHTSPAVKW